MAPKSKRLLSNLLLLAAVVAAGLVVLEFTVRIRTPAVKQDALNHFDESKSYVYELNANHPAISSQGFRDREFAVPKPPGVYRILALGDSVTYGLFTRPSQTYPKQLETNLRKGLPLAEVVNAGVNGYSLYNELYFFLEKGAALQPDLVLVGLCLNDIVNPLLHWKSPGGYIVKDVPRGAIPNFRHHRNYALPRMERETSAVFKFLMRSELFRVAYKHADLYLRKGDRYVMRFGRQWPVFLSDEDTTGIGAYEDPLGEEWQWMTRLLHTMDETFEARGIPWALVIFPLSYQLDQRYPYHPQERIMGFCREAGIACLDLLPIYMEQVATRSFIGKHRYHDNDVWHLSEDGHAIAAQAIEDFLVKRRLPGIGA